MSVSLVAAASAFDASLIRGLPSGRATSAAAKRDRPVDKGAFPSRPDGGAQSRTAFHNLVVDAGRS